MGSVSLFEVVGEIFMVVSSVDQGGYNDVVRRYSTIAMVESGRVYYTS